MTQVLFIAVGGALGALARFFSGALALKLLGGNFPFGTLLVNVAGSFLLGVVYVLTTQKGMLPDEFRLFFAIGFLGSYTTFSTFALDSVLLSDSGTMGLALINILLNVTLSIAAVVGGMMLTRMLLVQA
ncbi:CrcB protein [Desulfurispirillum indicum S5]|uniref:Fluoride-specific ion channel FluC n=1 Tax=Desulfurispirillum indicum (strain ATCC BAA-1389 / DSM 22839 / S5) TaxID=653733 RepID=E6W087_DESIS|nr:fluoride efflux transporter CrcB [Desulfurispirillum indicum]ADU65213.1 CrcB protein [Desulfurispirillum indicum S5]